MTIPRANAGTSRPHTATRPGPAAALVLATVALILLVVANDALARGRGYDDGGGGGGGKKGSEYDLDGGRGFDPYGKDDPYADRDQRHGKPSPNSFYGESPDGKKRTAKKPRNPDADVAVTHGGAKNARNGKDRKKGDYYNDHSRNTDGDGERAPKVRGGGGGTSDSDSGTSGGD